MTVFFTIGVVNKNITRKRNFCRQSGGFLGSLLSKQADPLMTVAVPLAKNILAPLEITAAASAIDAGVQKKINTWFKSSSILRFADNNFNNFKQKNE